MQPVQLSHTYTIPATNYRKTTHNTSSHHITQTSLQLSHSQEVPSGSTKGLGTGRLHYIHRIIPEEVGHD